MKKILGIALTAACVAGLVACGPKEEPTYEIACVTDVGQLMDGGFNQGTYEGVKNYAEAHGKTYNYYAPAHGADATDEDRVAAMNLAIDNGAKIIVTPGFLQATALTQVAEENPDVKFVFVDGWAIGKDNVTAVVYKEEQSGFLAGYGAVMDGYTKLGGVFGGGLSNPACNRFALGYVEGIKAAAAAKAVDCEVKVSWNYGDSFSASPELLVQSANWYKDTETVEGTQVIFSCGGSMLQSVKAACEAYTTPMKETYKKKMIIGVDTDQASQSERVLTSAFKGLTVSVEKILDQYFTGKWDAELKNTCQNLGADENATGLPTADGSWRFATWTKAQYTEVFNKIATGTLAVDATKVAAVGQFSATPTDGEKDAVKTLFEGLGDSRVTVTVVASN